ncbi:hypothetical protein [Staphylococcus aureus]|uniref:hypothetical protein n=1 Tax=Staphylococcus aureus TaxID=1280 RepID=UPI001CC6ADCB|nr:hypothetical protein [Staphylococcus aureus]MBZ5391588.1 hypothetical protein [Staphylococcus aureus]WJB69495.1 hypothetical protein PCM04_09105 [Staphylococcus aureus]WJC77227.1 hypothetical protein PCM63_09120 [Staphylococcus aureus]HCZ0476087.1 hypothetical protein [Staphylococcus aureus]
MGKRAQHSEIGSSVSTDIASWGAKHSEIGSSVSTDIASWGAKHSEIGSSVSTDIASWGNGPNIVKLDPQFLLTLQVGGPNTEAGGKSAYYNV